MIIYKRIVDSRFEMTAVADLLPGIVVRRSLNPKDSDTVLVIEGTFSQRQKIDRVVDLITIEVPA